MTFLAPATLALMLPPPCCCCCGPLLAAVGCCWLQLQASKHFRVRKIISELRHGAVARPGAWCSVVQWADMQAMSDNDSTTTFEEGVYLDRCLNLLSPSKIGMLVCRKLHQQAERKDFCGDKAFYKCCRT